MCFILSGQATLYLFCVCMIIDAEERILSTPKNAIMKTQAPLFSMLLFLILCAAMQAQQGGDPLLDRPGIHDEFAARQPFYLPNKLIQPPVYGWDKPKNIYAVNATEGGTLSYKTGTKIYVPAQAFVDETGEPVQGNVQIDYREFRNPADFLFSGIPMTYDSGGSTHLFESAGMFEITASQEGHQVYLAKDKPVKMDFASTDSSTAYNFYVLDEKQGTWVNKGKTDVPRVVASETQIIRYSGAVQDYLEYKQRLASLNLFDTVGFENRFADTDYFYTTLASGQKRNSEGNYTDYQDKGEFKSLIRLTRVASGKKKEIAFKMKLSSKEFPEMAAFGGMKWVITDKESMSSFRAKYSYKKVFNDIRVEQTEQGYAITLKSEEGFVTMNAYPVNSKQLGKKEHPAGNTNANRKAYVRALNMREMKFNQMLAKDKKANAKRYVPEEKYWASLKGKMSDHEKPMTFVLWKQHCDSFLMDEKKNLMASAASEGAIIRSLQLDGMGVFNCDQIQRLTDPVVAKARYSKEDGSAVKTKATYIIDNRINGVLRYDGYMGYSPAKIAYSPGSDNILITIKEDGLVAWSDQKNFRDNTEKNKVLPEFKVNEVDPNKMSVDEFRKMAGLR